MNIKKVDWGKLFLVFNIAIIVSVLNIFHVIIGYAKTLPGQIYMGTGHYYLDYFYYLQAIGQGMQGNWLYEDYYHTVAPLKTFLGPWQYLIIGKVGGLFHLSPVVSYWLSVLIFSIILCLLIFTMITKILTNLPFYKQMIAYILCLFAAPFFKIISGVNSSTITIFDFWNDKSVLLKRFGSVPYHISAEIFALGTLLIVADTINKSFRLSDRSVGLRGLTIVLAMSFLITFSPSAFFLLTVSLAIIGAVTIFNHLAKKKKDSRRLFIFFSLIFIIIVPVGIIVKNYLTKNLYAGVSQVEKIWQPQLTIWQFVLVCGPVFVLGLLGVVNYFKNLTPTRLILLVYVLVSYLMFFSSLPVYLETTNTRFLTPFSYILFASLVVLGIKKTKPLIVATVLLFLLCLPANIIAFKTQLNDRNFNSPITYLPKGIIEGLKLLDRFSDKRAVLTTPAQFLGVIVPTYTGKPFYLAYPNQKGYYEYADLSYRLYTGLMTKEEGRSFLNNNKIGYVITTSIEAFYQPGPLLKYPFLKEIYRNPDIVIFKVL